MYSFLRHAQLFSDAYNIFHPKMFMILFLVEHSYGLPWAFIFFIGVPIGFINHHVENGTDDSTEHVFKSARTFVQ